MNYLHDLWAAFVEVGAGLLVLLLAAALVLVLWMLDRWLDRRRKPTIVEFYRDSVSIDCPCCEHDHIFFVSAKHGYSYMRLFVCPATGRAFQAKVRG